MTDDLQLVELYRAASSAQAHMLASALEDAGIKALVDGDELQSAAGAIPVGWPTAPRILVPPSDLGRARGLLERLEPTRPVT